VTLLHVAKAWRDQDPDPETRDELDGLIADAEAGDEDAVAQLHDRFDTRLEFGTAGLRGIIGAGPNRMNRAVVLRTTWGLARYIEQTFGEDGKKRGVVIGFDGRHDYAAIGSVTNLASRLCDEAAPWQILVTERVFAAAGPVAVGEAAGTRDLPGFSRRVHAYDIKGIDNARTFS
jgi:hypothetical protein